jgi:hypothetical protein
VINTAKSPDGESPFEVELRAVPALYDLILHRPESNIVFVGILVVTLVHGRLLRIILSSILFRNLDHMSEFTHHNTCINLLDIIIHNDSNGFLGEPLLDTYKLIDGRFSTFDDNVDVKPVNVPLKTDTKPNILLPKVNHPKNIQIIPVMLDDRRHLNSIAL